MRGGELKVLQLLHLVQEPYSSFKLSLLQKWYACTVKGRLGIFILLLSNVLLNTNLNYGKYLWLYISLAHEVQCLINITEHKHYYNQGKRVKQNNENIHHGRNMYWFNAKLFFRNYFSSGCPFDIKMIDSDLCRL